MAALVSTNDDDGDNALLLGEATPLLLSPMFDSAGAAASATTASGELLPTPRWWDGAASNVEVTDTTNTVMMSLMSAAIDSLGVVLWRLAPDGTVRHVSDHLGHALPHLVLENPVGHHVCETLSMMDRQPFEHNVLYGNAASAVYQRLTKDGRRISATARVIRTLEPRTAALQEILLVERGTGYGAAAAAASAVSPPASATQQAATQQVEVEAELAELHALTSYHTDILFQFDPTSLIVLTRTAGDGREPALLSVGASILQSIHPNDRPLLTKVVASLGLHAPSTMLRIYMRPDDTDDDASTGWTMWSLSLCAVIVHGAVETINGVARRSATVNRIRSATTSAGTGVHPPPATPSTRALAGATATGMALGVSSGPPAGRRSRSGRRAGDSTTAAAATAADLRSNRTLSLPDTAIGRGTSLFVPTVPGGRASNPAPLIATPPPLSISIIAPHNNNNHNHYEATEADSANGDTTAVDLANLAPCFSDDALYSYGPHDGNLDSAAGTTTNGDSSPASAIPPSLTPSGLAMARAGTWPALRHDGSGRPETGGVDDRPVATEDESPFAWLHFGEGARSFATDGDGIDTDDHLVDYRAVEAAGLMPSADQLWSGGAEGLLNGDGDGDMSNTPPPAGKSARLAEGGSESDPWPQPSDPDRDPTPRHGDNHRWPRAVATGTGRGAAASTGGAVIWPQQNVTEAAIGSPMQL